MHINYYIAEGLTFNVLAPLIFWEGSIKYQIQVQNS